MQFKACDFSTAARDDVRGCTLLPLCERKPAKDGIGGPRIYAPSLLFFDVAEASKADKEREKERERKREREDERRRSGRKSRLIDASSLFWLIPTWFGH